MRSIDQGPEPEARIYDFAAFAPETTRRLSLVATTGRARGDDFGTSPEDAPPPTSFPVRERRGVEELGRAISAAASISTEDRPLGDFPVLSAKGLPSIQEGWLLMRGFLSIKSAERRQAVLNYVFEQAQRDKA